MPNVLDISSVIKVEELAKEIGNKWENWHSSRSTWLESKKELISYLEATDTRGKVGSEKQPWNNTTVRPKLTSIYDNLLVNYISALFPNDDWLDAQGSTQDSMVAHKREVYKAYAKEKARKGEFFEVTRQLISDFIIFGNCFATVEFVTEKTIQEDDSEIFGYVGPRILRIHPYDIVFDPTARTFENSPKIIRSVKSLGDLAREVEENSDNLAMKNAFEKLKKDRKTILKDAGDANKQFSFSIQGFGSISEYYSSNSVEILEFYGDIYDLSTNKFYKNHIITIADRTTVLSKRPNPSWLGRSPIFHAGWRVRTDNLWAMGPLDNLVGMQHRIDHLENMRADAFDLIAAPMFKIQGPNVQDFTPTPGLKIYTDTDSDVTMLHPDTTVLQADFQIDKLMMSMEEFAGSPRESMGFRTAGEKTAFEMNVLKTGGERHFIDKLRIFERMLEKLLNALVEMGRRNMKSEELIPLFDKDYSIALFETISQQDLSTNIKLYLVGSRHYEAKATLVQNLLQLFNSGVGQDPAVNVHMSGKKIAELLQEALNLKQYNLVSPFIRITENSEGQLKANVAQENTMAATMTPSGISESTLTNADVLT